MWWMRSNKANMGDLIDATEIGNVNAKIEAKLAIVLAPVILTLDRWSWKGIMNLTYALSSYVHHFMDICEFKPELSSRNVEIGVTWRFLTRVYLRFGGWLSKTIGHLLYATSSCVLHFVVICIFKLESRSGNAQIGAFFSPPWSWSLTSKLELLQGHHFCQWQKSTMIQKRTLCKRCDRRTDG